MLRDEYWLCWSGYRHRCSNALKQKLSRKKNLPLLNLNTSVANIPLKIFNFIHLNIYPLQHLLNVCTVELFCLIISSGGWSEASMKRNSSSDCRINIRRGQKRFAVIVLFGKMYRLNLGTKRKNKTDARHLRETVVSAEIAQPENALRCVK